MVLERKVHGAGLLELLSGIIPRGKEAEDLLAGVADTFHRHRRVAELAGLLGELHERHPDNPFILNALGTLQIKTGDFHAAIATYTKLHQRQPDSTDSARRLAGLYAKIGDFDRAGYYLRPKG
jgi:predicted Zn-dependent protease